MEKSEKSLQKITDDNYDPVTALLQREEFTQQDIDNLSENDFEDYDNISSRLDTMEEGAIADSYEPGKIGLWSIEHRNKTFHHNNALIVNCIYKNLNERNVFPSSVQIAEETGLSRQAVSRHLKNYNNNPAFKEYFQQSGMFKLHILSNLTRMAMSGNIQAMKLYFKLMGDLDKPKIEPATTQNFVQINGLTINQQVISSLPTEQINKIEQTLKEMLKQTA